MSKKISIRDNRTHSTFRTDFDIVFEWLPFIGGQAFALYSLYLALTERGRAMGVRAMGKRAGMGSASVQRYTILLVHCGLIEKERGNPIQPNNITIIDPPVLDYQLIEDIMDDVQNDTRLNLKVRAAMMTRAERWQPMPAAPTSAVLPAPYMNGNGNGQAADDVAGLVSQLQRVCHEYGSNNGAYFNGATKWVTSTNRTLLGDWLDRIEDGVIDLVKIDGVAGWIRQKVEGEERPPALLVNRRDPANPVPDEYQEFVTR